MKLQLNGLRCLCFCAVCLRLARGDGVCYFPPVCISVRCDCVYSRGDGDEGVPVGPQGAV